MHVLITTEGSEISNDVLQFGAQFSGPSDEIITVLTVIRSESERMRGEDVLLSASEVLESEGLNVQTKIRIGTPSIEILNEANEGQYGIIVLGAPARNGFADRLFKRPGIFKVVEEATRPVLIVKSPYRPICKILLCDSGVKDSSLPGRFAVLCADLSEHEEDITILHVMSQISAGPGITGKQLRAEAEDLILEHSPEADVLERNIEILSQPLIHPHPKIRHGFVVDEILSWTIWLVKSSCRSIARFWSCHRTPFSLTKDLKIFNIFAKFRL
jgi:nucleotide-binding universal stress UspA family protein